MFTACSNLAFIFGPLLSGYLADLDNSLQLCMLCGASIFTLNSLFVLLLVRPVSTQVEERSRRDLKEMLTLKHVLSSLNIFQGFKWWDTSAIIALRFATTFSVIMFRSNLSIFLQDHFAVGYKTLGKIISFNGIASALAALSSGYVSRLYSSHRRQLTHLLLLLGLSILGATCAPSVTLMLVMLVPLSLATSNLQVCMLSLFLSRVSKEEKGGVIGLSYSISSVSRMLGPSAVGLAQEVSSELSGYLSAALLAMAVLAMLWFPLETKRHGNWTHSHSS